MMYCKDCETGVNTHEAAYCYTTEESYIVCSECGGDALETLCESCEEQPAMQYLSYCAECIMAEAYPHNATVTDQDIAEARFQVES